MTAVAGAKKARALIVQITLFGGFASTVFWPLTHMLDETIGWRATWLIYAGLSTLVCAPLHYFVLPSSKTYARDDDRTSDISQESPLVPARERGLAQLHDRLRVALLVEAQPGEELARATERTLVGGKLLGTSVTVVHRAGGATTRVPTKID